MAKNTPAASTTEKKKRTPRTLTDLEIEAKAAYENARAIGKLMPQVAKLSPSGRQQLRSQLEKMDVEGEFKA